MATDRLENALGPDTARVVKCQAVGILYYSTLDFDRSVSDQLVHGAHADAFNTFWAILVTAELAEARQIHLLDVKQILGDAFEFLPIARPPPY